MPNFDGGHYFLTTLIPIRTNGLTEHQGIVSSPVHMVRDALATLPTALQSPISEKTGLNSPFARSKRTHLARFAVIDNVIFNGRNHSDAVDVAVTSKNLLLPEKVDKLTTPYLIFVADFDAQQDHPEELKSYLAELWQVMEPELKAVLQYCIGFEKVTDATSFQDYILRCQIETTMPFNDYWISPPPIPSFSALGLAIPSLLAIVAILLGWLMPHLGHTDGPWSSVLKWGWVALGLSIPLVYWRIMANGRKPFPTAPHSDLPSVLKAVYLQQKFTQFAIDAQGQDAASLHRQFGEFMAQHQPLNVQGPTQPAGVIRS